MRKFLKKTHELKLVLWRTESLFIAIKSWTVWFSCRPYALHMWGPKFDSITYGLLDTDKSDPWPQRQAVLRPYGLLLSLPLFLFSDHTQRCPGLILGSVFRDHSQRAQWTISGAKDQTQVGKCPTHCTLVLLYYLFINLIMWNSTKGKFNLLWQKLY